MRVGILIKCSLVASGPRYTADRKIPFSSLSLSDKLVGVIVRNFRGAMRHTLKSDLSGTLSLAGCGVVLLGAAASLDALQTLAMPKEKEPIVKTLLPAPQVGEVLTVHGATLELQPSVYGMRAGIISAQISAKMTFTDQHGRKILAVLDTANFPGQELPSLKVLEHYTVEGGSLRLESSSSEGAFRVSVVKT